MLLFLMKKEGLTFWIDAIRVVNELGAPHFFPMHFGTCDLSDESLLEPLDILTEHEDKNNGKLIFPTVGKNIW